MPGEHGFERVGNLPDRGAGAARLDREREQVARAGPRRLGQCRERRAAARRVAGLAHPFEPGDLGRADRRVVDIEDVDFGGIVGLVLVGPDDDLVALVDCRLAPRRGFFDAQFRHAALDRLCHAAQCLDLVDEGHRRRGDRVGQGLDVIAAAERVDDMRDGGLLGEDQLGVAGDPG